MACSRRCWSSARSSPEPSCGTRRRRSGRGCTCLARSSSSLPRPPCLGRSLARAAVSAGLADAVASPSSGCKSCSASRRGWSGSRPGSRCRRFSRSRAADAIVRTLHAVVGYWLFAVIGRVGRRAAAAAVEPSVRDHMSPDRRSPTGGRGMKAPTAATLGSALPPCRKLGRPTTSRSSGRAIAVMVLITVAASAACSRPTVGGAVADAATRRPRDRPGHRRRQHPEPMARARTPTPRCTGPTIARCRPAGSAAARFCCSAWRSRVGGFGVHAAGGAAAAGRRRHRRSRSSAIRRRLHAAQAADDAQHAGRRRARGAAAGDRLDGGPRPARRRGAAACS